jgi:hypothetical protein
LNFGLGAGEEGTKGIIFPLAPDLDFIKKVLNNIKNCKVS